MTIDGITRGLDAGDAQETKDDATEQSCGGQLSTSRLRVAICTSEDGKLDQLRDWCQSQLAAKSYEAISDQSAAECPTNRTQKANQEQEMII